MRNWSARRFASHRETGQRCAKDIYIDNRGCPRAYTKSRAAHVQCLRLSDVNRLTKSMAAHVQCLRLSVVNRLTKSMAAHVQCLRLMLTGYQSQWQSMFSV